MGAGVAIFITEIWRDWAGRGSLLNGVAHIGFIDGPQIAAVLLVLAGAVTLREAKPVPHETKNDPRESEYVPHEQEREPHAGTQAAPETESRGAA